MLMISFGFFFLLIAFLNFPTFRSTTLTHVFEIYNKQICLKMVLEKAESFISTVNPEYIVITDMKKSVVSGA